MYQSAKTGAPDAVPALIHCLSRRDQECVEAISALVAIAQRNHQNHALVHEIVTALTPLLADEQKVRLLPLFYPVDTMPIDEFVALNLRYIASSESLI